MDEDSTKELSTNELLRMILARLDSVETRLTSVETRLTALEEKVDHRLMETRPIWEAVLIEMKELKAEYKDDRRWFRQTFKQLIREQEGLNERLEKLEDIVLPRQ